MSDSPAGTFGSRLSQAIKRLVMVTMVLGLGGAVVVLLSQLNARTFSLELTQGTLVVRKGRQLPFGSEPWRPADPVLADAYAPLELEGLEPTYLNGQTFTERDQLDRALFQVIESLAKPRVRSEDPKHLERGLYFLRRADKLAGLSEEQRLSLKALNGEVAFYQARGKLEEAQELIAEALAQLRLAASAQNQHARSANQMIAAVEPQAMSLEDSLRRAVNELSAPAQPPAPPETPAVAPNSAEPPEPAEPAEDPAPPAP